MVIAALVITGYPTELNLIEPAGSGFDVDTVEGNIRQQSEKDLMIAKVRELAESYQGKTLVYLDAPDHQPSTNTSQRAGLQCKMSALIFKNPVLSLIHMSVC